MKGEVKLAPYRKRLRAPAKGEKALPALFLVHGSSLSALSSYDLTGPSMGDRAKQFEFYKTHNRRTRDLAMVRSIFTRDKPGTAADAVKSSVETLSTEADQLKSQVDGFLAKMRAA